MLPQHRLKTGLAVLLAAGFLSACGSTAPETGSGTITGTVYGPETSPTSLGAGSELRLVLADVTQGLSEAVPVGEATQIAVNQLPAEFEMTYDNATIDPAKDYAVLAQVADGSDTAYTSHGVPIAIDGGKAKDVGVRLRAN